MRITALMFAGAAGILAVTPSVADAACGSAFCSVNTDWNVQGIYVQPGARAELRYEYLDQDTLRKGRDEISASEFPAHHDEVRTVNQALFATFDYNFASGWGVSAIVPGVKRQHEHIHNHQGEAIPEEWYFTELADIRIAGRYQFAVGQPNPERPRLAGGLFGLKLPTGKSDVTNDEGEEAERSLQPGTGTTDMFLGGYYQVQFPASGFSYFAQAAYAFPLNSHDGFKPGDRANVDLGVRYELTQNLALLLQLNWLWKDRDSGDQAEPEDSGGQFVFISPGVSVMVSRNVQLFALVQLPIYQYVNGIQLTADWGATGGVGFRF